ncbi:MAG TPA: T9SS sorting signal type C domain-containing protein [Flavobacterium sp.]|nr:T9SS sorting signal type C domain-containing protein [Flavobacterium sp.]
MKQKLHQFSLKYALFLVVCFMGLNTWGQVSITALPYTKSDNFDAYNPSSATNATNTLPAGWSLSGPASYNGRSTGTANGGGFYAYGVTTPSVNFSLGALPSSTNTYTYTVSFVNNSGSAITSLKLSWDYQQWRYGGANTSGWDLTGTGALATNTTLNGKDFSGVATGTNGNVATTPVAEFTLTGLNIAPGASFGMSWVSTNLSGTDNGVSIDNFNMTATGLPPVAPVVTGATFNGTVATAFSQTISATGNPTSYTLLTGTLPAGLSLNTTTGAITGTPTAVSSASVTVKATNTVGDSDPATINFNIGKGSQTITFANINKQYGDADFALTGTSSSGLAVSYSSSNPAVATISGTTVTIIGAGTTNITASQAGDANYNAATDVVRTLTVSKKNANITGVTANNKVADGTTAATLSGTPTLTGILAADVANVTLGGTPVATFASSAIGNGIAVTVTGYTISGSAAANYNVVQPTGLTANITAIAEPVATAATAVNANDFTAHWSAVPQADAYLLDVSEYASFSTSATANILEKFESGLSTSGYGFGTVTLTSGVWSINAVLRAAVSSAYDGYGAQLRASDGKMTSPSFSKVTSVTFFAKRGSSASTLKVSKIVGGVTTLLESFPLDNLGFDEYTVAVNETASDVKIVFENGSGVGYIDEVTINYTTTVPSFVTGYDGKNVGNVTSYVVTGLNPNTTYHYRVRAKNTSTTSANSNVIDVTTALTTVTWNGTAWSNVSGPTATIEAVIAGAYNTNTNGVFTAKKLTLNSGSFRLASGTNITVVNDVVNNMTAADFVIENNANLIQTNAVANTGAVTVHRNSAPIVRLDHTLWSAPVEGQNLFGFSPNTLTNRFYTYQTTTNTYVNTGLTASSTFVPGKGFAVRAPNNYQTSPAAAWEGTFVGKPNNGNVTFTLENTGTGYNLVGNPYPSVIDGTAFLGGNATIDGTLYFYAHTLTMNAQGQFPAGTNYATWTPGSGGVAATLGTSGVPANVPNGKIQVGQGFIVKSIPAGGNVSFVNTMRSTDNNDQFFRGVAGATTATPEEIERHRIWLNLTNDSGTAFNQILVAYAQGATEGVDRGYDGLAFGNTGSSLSSKIEAADYTIQGRALPFNDNDVVTLGFKAATAGNYTITLSSFDGLFAGNQDVYIKDNANNGALHNLKNGGYTFASAEGTFDNRFEVVYKSTLGTIDATLDANAVVVYKQNTSLHIETKNTSIKEVTIFDINGRMVYQKAKVNNNTLVISDLSVAQQVLLVQLTAEDNKTTTVKVIY